MLASLLAALALLTGRGRFDDPDLWWHLKLGQIVWQTHHIPSVDLFSYTTNHHSYTAHEWLAQLSMYAAYHALGYSGVMAWFFTFSAAILIVGYVLCSIYSGNAKVAFVGGLTIWLFSTIGTAPRPQLVGYLLLTVELILLHLGRTRSARWFYWLPPLFALWINCHGSWFVGLGVALVYLVTSFVPSHAGLVSAETWLPETRKVLGVAVVLSAAALLLNPGGTGPLLYPLNAALKQPLTTTQVDEWQALQFGNLRALAMLALCAAVLLIPLLRRRPIPVRELLLVGLSACGAASHRRMLFVFGIVAAPVFVRLIADTWETYTPERDLPPANAILIGAAAVTIFLGFPRARTLEAQVEAQSPAAAVRYMQQHHIRGPVVNEYVFGGYLIWAAPEYPVFIDGRADVFEWTGVLSEFGRWAQLQDDPRELLDRHGVNVCLMAQGAPMNRVLPLLGGWHSVYSDKVAVVWVRNQS